MYLPTYVYAADFFFFFFFPDKAGEPIKNHPAPKPSFRFQSYT